MLPRLTSFYNHFTSFAGLFSFQNFQTVFSIVLMFYSSIISVSSVPTGLKRGRDTFFYKHIVPTGLKTLPQRIYTLKLTPMGFAHALPDLRYFVCYLLINICDKFYEKNLKLNNPDRYPTPIASLFFYMI